MLNLFYLFPAALIASAVYQAISPVAARLAEIMISLPV
jgi:hypothetical protein